MRFAGREVVAKIVRSAAGLQVLLACMVCSAGEADRIRRSPVGTYLTVPDTLVATSGARVEVERGLFLVPENRRDPNSRTIGIHFIRFAAAQRHPETGRPPVFVLPGGPGAEFNFGWPPTLKLFDRLRRTRDVVYVSQRGNPKSPGLVPPLRALMSKEPLDVPGSTEGTRQRQRSAIEDAVRQWSARGVDLRGYDILNVVDDVYELRAALGYSRIVLRGCSFGSQWSFAYLKRWPGTVDRALLSGVEPLDYGYDSPSWVWQTMARLARRAEADRALARFVPAGGVMGALQEVLRRLEERPVTVSVQEPRAGRPVQVTLGAADLRGMLTDGALFGDTREERLGNWPRFILEMYAGDYRYLAAAVWESREEEPGRGVPLIGALIDNSLGITAARDAKLLADPRARWLGDINAYYHNTRDLVPTMDVGDSFRSDWAIDVPVLMLAGDLDWSTPIDNARHARGFLKRGHLIEIGGGTHCDEVDAAETQLPQVMDQVYDFVDADFVKVPPGKWFHRLPDRVAYAPIRFALPAGASLYDQWLARR